MDAAYSIERALLVLVASTVLAAGIHAADVACHSKRLKQKGREIVRKHSAIFSKRWLGYWGCLLLGGATCGACYPNVATTTLAFGADMPAVPTLLTPGHTWGWKAWELIGGGAPYQPDASAPNPAASFAKVDKGIKRVHHVNRMMLASIVWSVVNTVIADTAMTYLVRDAADTTATSYTMYTRCFNGSHAVAGDGVGGAPSTRSSSSSSIDGRDGGGGNSYSSYSGDGGGGGSGGGSPGGEGATDRLPWLPAVKLYRNVGRVPSLSEATWMFLSPLLLLLLHDCWFFLVHSALHRSKMLYATIHAWHHERNAPSAFDVFYMHPVESFTAVVVPFLLVPRFIPIHWFIWEGMLAKGIMIDVYGHCGFDASPFHPFKLTQFSIVPRFPYKTVFLAAKHHDDHHRYRTCNYSLYFPVWDRVFGTYKA